MHILILLLKNHKFAQFIFLTEEAIENNIFFLAFVRMSFNTSSEILLTGILAFVNDCPLVTSGLVSMEYFVVFCAQGCVDCICSLEDAGRKDSQA